MQKIEFTSKLVLAALIATVVFSAITVPSVVAQSTSSPPIRANSVTSGSIKDGEVKNPDLGTDAVTTGKIKNGEVMAEDIAAGVIPSDTIGSLKKTIKQQEGDVLPHSTHTFRVSCDAGQVLTGGGHYALDVGLVPSVSAPEGSNTWIVVITATGDSGGHATAYGMCVEII